MKKLISTLIVLSGILISYSCSNDLDENNLIQESGIRVSVLTTNEKNLSSSEWLHFESVNDYERAIALLNEIDNNLSLFEKGLSFQSMRCELTEKQRETIGIEDDILAALLNPEGFIQIDNYIFQIDIADKNISVWNTKNKDKKVFSIDENVINILFKDDAKYSTTSNNPDPIKYEFNSNPKAKCKIVYQRAAIYFSLLSKINKPESISSPAVEIYYHTYSGSYTKNRNNATQQTYSAKSDGGGGNKYVYRPYSAAVGLKQFYMSSVFTCIDHQTNYSQTVGGTITK